MIIELDKNKFKNSYFALTRDEAIISAIVSKEKGKGHFSELLENLKLIRKRIEVPTPSKQMQEILLNKGFHWEKKFFGEGFNDHGDILVLEDYSH